MFLTARWPLLAAVSFTACLLASCGARTGIENGQAGAPQAPILCVTDLDCATGDACAGAICQEGTCVPLPATVCDDHDACTTDSCDADTGKCAFTSVTLDLDGDGYKSPKPGFAPGAPGSCGDDCDDRSAAAHPGGTEACDGVDNDCNGKIDDNAVYGGLTQPLRVSSDAFGRSNRGGIAFDGKEYGVTYSGHEQLWSSYFRGLSRDGSTLVPETSLADVNSETYAGSLLHNGSYFESAWADARQDGNYEIYFNRFDSNAGKLGPALRVTAARNFSLNPSLAWNGTESLLVWDDRRFEGQSGDDTRIFGQRIAFDGTLVGGNVQLTPSGVRGDSPGIALGQSRVGIAFTSQSDSNLTSARFFTTAPDLSAPSALVDLGGTHVEDANIAFVAKRFVVAWQTKIDGVNYGPSIYGAVVDETGAIVVPAQPITSGAMFARTFSMVSLGDRLMLVWVDDHDGNYELYQEILDENLQVSSPRTRLSFTPADTLSPVATLGAKGDLAVLYDDWQTGDRQTYFLSMSCAMGGATVPPGK